jgi:xanthine/uracil/vitamin C permease (AzgA family)
MTLMKAGGASFLAGIALIVFGTRTELEAINKALSRRLKTGIALVLGGIALTLIGARLQGQIVFRKYARRFRQILERPSVARPLAFIRAAVKSILASPAGWKMDKRSGR